MENLNAEFILGGVIAEEGTDVEQVLVLEIGDISKCEEFFSKMTDDEKKPFIEIYIMEKEEFADSTISKIEKH